MKLIIVNYQDYDCYSAKVAHPREFSSKESLMQEFDLAREKEFQDITSYYEDKRDIRYYRVKFMGLEINMDTLSLDSWPEFYTVEEWFERYKNVAQEDVWK